MDLRANSATKRFAEDSLLKINAARPEVLDRFSLHFCVNPEQDALFDAVPMNDRGQEADIDLHPEGQKVVAVAPDPFRRDPLVFSIMARRLPRRTYASDLEFRKTVAAVQFFL